MKIRVFYIYINSGYVLFVVLPFADYHLLLISNKIVKLKEITKTARLI